MSTWDEIAAAAKPIADAADAERSRLDADLATALDRAGTAETRVAELEAEVAALTPLKPGLAGMVTTDPNYLRNIPYAEFCSTKPKWNAIEKAPGVYDFSAVDAMLAANPTIKFRLRFMAGIHAPEWVKAASGGGVLITPDSTNGGTGYVPRYWTDAYLADYVAFMQAVANRYEANPQVVEIPNSATTTIFAEPFILGADAASIDRLWQAGYTKGGHADMLCRSTAAMMDMFPTTRISLAGHSKWQFIVQGTGGPGDGKAASSWEDERTLLNDLSAIYGKRLVIEDHGLGPDDIMPTGQPRETATSWYAYMAGLRDTEQTYGWQFTLNGGDMNKAADMGVAAGACFLEYAAFSQIAEPKRRQVHDALLVNAEGR